MPLPLAVAERPVPPIMSSVALNMASDESDAATLSPCMETPSVEPSENVYVTKPENGPLPDV